MSTLLEELSWRGLVYDATDGVSDLLAEGPVTAYIGFDPTAASLHVGSLLVIMALKMHDFWSQTDAQAKQTETIAFFKNISMAGGAIFMFALMGIDGAPYGPAITESLFNFSY